MTYTTRSAWKINEWLLAVAIIVAACSVALAADEPASGKAASKPAKQESSALDDSLLEDLKNDLLEEAGDLKRPKEATPNKDTQRSGADAEKLPPIDGEDFGKAGEDEDPLRYISQEMRFAERLMTEQAKGATAEAVQKRIVGSLEKLIEQAQQQQAAQQSSQKDKKQQASAQRQQIQQPKSATTPGKDSNKPAQDSSERMGTAEQARPDPELLRGLMKDAWGHLPARARDQMLQTSPERFLPKYELMIERYYKRLADEQNRR